jgi:hypothetical protein
MAVFPLGCTRDIRVGICNQHYQKVYDHHFVQVLTSNDRHLNAIVGTAL